MSYEALLQLLASSPETLSISNDEELSKWRLATENNSIAYSFMTVQNEISYVLNACSFSLVLWKVFDYLYKKIQAMNPTLSMAELEQNWLDYISYPEFCSKCIQIMLDRDIFAKVSISCGISSTQDFVQSVMNSLSASITGANELFKTELGMMLSSLDLNARLKRYKIYHPFANIDSSLHARVDIFCKRKGTDFNVFTPVKQVTLDPDGEKTGWYTFNVSVYSSAAGKNSTELITKSPMSCPIPISATVLTNTQNDCSVIPLTAAEAEGAFRQLCIKIPNTRGYIGRLY